MTKVVVKQEFRDKDDFSKVYTAGMEVSFEDERAKMLASAQLVDIVESPTAKEEIPVGKAPEMAKPSKRKPSKLTE